VAISLDRGDIAWRAAHGDTPDNIRNHPLLRGMDIPRTGRPGSWSPRPWSSSARKAPCHGRQMQGCLSARLQQGHLDAGAVYMPAPQTGSRMTYVLNGKQYIVLGSAAAIIPRNTRLAVCQLTASKVFPHESLCKKFRLDRAFAVISAFVCLDWRCRNSSGLNHRYTPSRYTSAAA
jgi:hypothetical protein